MGKLNDYDKWHKPCGKCGLDNGKAASKSKNICWKCGGRLERDYSNRALKESLK